MFKPGIDDLVFIGFAQAVPTLFPFVECQARLLAAYAVGALRACRGRTRWSEVIDADQRCTSATCIDRAPAHPAGRLLRLRARPAHQGDPGGRPRAQRPTSGRVGRRPRPATDRRPPQRVTSRRDALLESLDQHLQESSLESINIADISRRAGVTRSAFYFYFENKAAAVAALMEEMYDEIFAVIARAHHPGDGTPREHAVGTMVDGLFARPGRARAPVPRDARGPRDQPAGARDVGRRPASRSSSRSRR